MSRKQASSRKWRMRVFVAICATSTLLAAGYAASVIRRTSASSADTRVVTSRLATPPDRPYLMVQSMRPDSHRKLMMMPLADPAGPPFETALKCERAHYSGNRGVCLAVEGTYLTDYYADIFNEDLQRLHRIRLTGVPSRTRVSPDGSRVAITVFEQGHSYAQHGFSTRTTILNTATGHVVGDLEQFAVTRNGARFHAADFNFWGVTFKADSSGFFATLASAGTRYLIEGDVIARTARVIRTGVECPSLSPDNTRIVYKSERDQRGNWQLRVYDLRSGSDNALTFDTRSVDDQVDWLDNDHVVFHITGSRGADAWVLRTDGTQTPRILREYAYAPAVVR